MPQETIAQQLYGAVTEALDAGWSINRIAEGARVSRPSLQDWYTGRRQSLSLETVSGLAAFFGMRLGKPKIPKADAEAQSPRRKPKAKSAKPKRSRKSKTERIGG